MSMRGGYLATESLLDTFIFCGLTLQQRIYCKRMRGTEQAEVTVSKHIMGHAVLFHQKV